MLRIETEDHHRMIAALLKFAHRGRGRLATFLLIAALGFGMSARAQLPPVNRSVVDLVVIYKGDRLLQLKSQGRVVHSFDIALGAQPKGHKLSEGDNRTPEGVYTLDWRNANSQFYRSIHISYPREDDRASAFRKGLSPGSLIMIHGLPNGRQATDMNHPLSDWTNGCIAVTNSEMDEIWSLVEDGTTIMIFP
ncbi:MAG: L,D-transpeptidase family protein [Geminicoccaceae bacterium]